MADTIGSSAEPNADCGKGIWTETSGQTDFPAGGALERTPHVQSLATKQYLSCHLEGLLVVAVGIDINPSLWSVSVSVCSSLAPTASQCGEYETPLIALKAEDA